MIIYSVRFKVITSIFILASTVLGYLLYVHPGILKAIVQWATPLLLAFLLVQSAVTAIWHAASDDSDDRPNAIGAFPADVGFRLISKWGLRR
jgi:hypothetical protein